MAVTAGSLTSSRRLALGAVWNFVGLAAPLIVAVFAIPLLLTGMGTERFGLLTIIWMGVGYFSLFDFGIGVALTRIVAERLGREDEGDLSAIIWTALSMLSVLGVIGGFALFVFADLLVNTTLQIDPPLRDEAITAFRTLAVGIPAVVLTAALIGLLEAYQRFAEIALVRVPLGVLTFAGPLATLTYSSSLALATGALLAARLVALVAYYIFAQRVSPNLRKVTAPRREHVGPLLRFGGWLTVTNIIGPLMTYLDRLFIAAMTHLAAVAYYVTPYEVLSRIQILPRSIMGVIFPAMAAASGGDRSKIGELYSTSVVVLLILMLPVTGLLFLFAPEGLELWLGHEFKEASTPVVRLLAVGWLINTLARPAFVALQGTGRPDLVAKTHMAELFPYLATLWILVDAFGITGAAFAWSARVLVDTLLLNMLAAATIPELASRVTRVYVGVLVILIGFAAGSFLEAFEVRAMLLVAVCLLAAAALWPFLAKLRASWAN